MRYIFVQLSPDEKTVVNYFGECFDPETNPPAYPQDEAVWPNQAIIINADARYIAFYDAWPGMNQFYIAPDRGTGGA